MSVWSQQPNDHIFPASAAARSFIDFDSKGFLVNGRRTFLVSAGIEYARVPRALWADRLLRLQRCGFNCVEVYTFWNFHEPTEGIFDFSGDHDLDAFLRLVKQLGLYAIVRVGPYYCAEWDNGGYPLWLRSKPDLRVREHNAPFEKYTVLFFDKLMPIVAANQVNRGGSVILVQLENEHPKAWGTDMPDDYFRFLREKALSLGLEVPYFFSGLHHASDPAGDSENLDDPSRPNPWLSTEFWSVWYNGYSSGEKEAKLYERRTWKIIAHGGNGYNYYMAHGGSNFGYTNNDEDAASYDYGAAVGQGGDLRPIYYTFKRAALFARSFAGVLENSTNATPAVRGMVKDSLIHFTARKGPAGELLFLDNTSDQERRIVLPADGGQDSITLAPGEIMPLVRDYLLTPGVRLTGNTARILAIEKQGGTTSLLVYGETGSRAKLHFLVAGQPVTKTTLIPGRIATAYWLNKQLRVLVMSRGLADRTWLIPAGDHSNSIVCGPSYAGQLSGGSLTTEEPVVASSTTVPTPVVTDYPTWIYTAAGTKEKHGTAGRNNLQGKALLNGWSGLTAANEAAPGYDDSKWMTSEWPRQMGADGDTTADAWYRTEITTTDAGEYTLLVDGADRATAFADGLPVSMANLKKGGELGFTLPAGRHVLAVFTAHDGRDKLPAYLGPIDSADRKGLFGKALLVRGRNVIKELEGWQVIKADGAADVEKSIPTTGWKPYTIGQDAFDKKEGYGWFRTELPAMPAGTLQARLHFASVDEDATVFINGRRITKHDGWNAPFDVVIDRMDTLQQPVKLTVFIGNHSNEGGIDQPVRVAELIAPIEIRNWRMRGGPSEIGSGFHPFEGSKAGVSDAHSAAESPDARAPRWWKTTFTLPANPGLKPVWRVLPTGLGHGSIWVNGHNLGRYPEKIPVNGLYVPDNWLIAGSNTLLIFDEDGRDVRQVSIEVETAASRRVTVINTL
jgi:beta-galactosidase